MQVHFSMEFYHIWSPE